VECRYKNPEVSIVVPVYNEVPTNLDALLEQLDVVFESLLVFYEVVFVDDGSRELTGSYVRGLAHRNKHVRMVVLSRNFGEQAAICAGLKHARGRAVINMDSDLQDSPDLIPTMLQHWRNGFDVVSTQQVNRSDSFLRLSLTNIFYWLLQKISSVSITNVGEFRLLSRRAVDALLQLPEKSVFLRHLIPWIGFKQIVIPFQRQQRVEGASAYTFLRLFKVALSGLVSCSNIPLVFVPLFGLNITLALGLFVILYCTSAGTVQLPPYIPLSLAWLFAVYSFFSMTVISCYIAATLIESRARPLYIVSDVISFSDDVGDRQDKVSSSETV
jgi:glycosyltransferase involved in cell wall biosynthesis